MYSPITCPGFSDFHCGCWRASFSGGMCSSNWQNNSGREFMRGSFRILSVLAVSLAIVPVTVLAQGQTNNQKQRTWGGNRNTTQNNTTTTPTRHGWGPHRSTARNTTTSNPPGWAHGRKVGWGGNNMPPGQARRNPYEHRYHRHHRRHRHHPRDWDRDHDRFRHHRDHDRH